MRISDCAELTGTTVRTIRYYHQIGLLPVPERVLGRRDYQLEHVARVLRVRWLSDAGLSLDQVAALLSQDDQKVGAPLAAGLHDLRSTAASIQTQIDELRDQHRKISALIEMAETSGELSALPPVWADFYEQLATMIDDPAAVEVLHREQRLAELFAQRGLIPEGAEDLLDRMTDDDRALVMSFYSRYARLPEVPDDEAQRVMDGLVHDMAAWCHANPELTRDFLRMLPSWARPRPMMRALLAFSTLLATHRRQAEVMSRILDDVADLFMRLDPADATNPTPERTP